MTRRPRTDWNQEPTDHDGIAVPSDDKDTEGHGVLPDPNKLVKSREFATRQSDERDPMDGFGPVHGDGRA